MAKSTQPKTAGAAKDPEYFRAVADLEKLTGSKARAMKDVKGGFQFKLGPGMRTERVPEGREIVEELPATGARLEVEPEALGGRSVRRLVEVGVDALAADVASVHGVTS